MDYFTKWAEAYALQDQQAETVARMLVTQFICRYGVPSQIHSDQGTDFESKLFRTLCQLLEIDKTRTTAYHPQSDGLVERFNRTLETMLSMYCKKDQSDWDQHFLCILMAYRASQQETTGATPNSLVFGREINLPLAILAGPLPDAKVQQPQPYAMEVKSKLEEAFEVARQHADGEQKRHKKLYNTRMHGSPYEPGDSVWLYCPAKYVGLSPKLRSQWKGPCTIIRKFSDANYLIRVPNATCQRQVVHFDRLKPCVLREGDDAVIQGETFGRQPTGCSGGADDFATWNDSDDTGQVVGDSSQEDNTFCYRRTRTGRVSRPPNWMRDFVI